MTVPINKIIPFSSVDGIGNRTSIFLQGCNIACQYCHNPETQRLCIGCGKCVEGCPSNALSMISNQVVWNHHLCTYCDKCIQQCEHFSSPKISWLTPEQVMVEVEKNIPFIRGITVSGGECSLHPNFLTQLFRLAKKRGLHCLLDSNGEIDFSQLPELMEWCDGVMLDVKAWDENIYHALTGGNVSPVKNNLQYLASMGKLEEVRVVVVPNEMDAENVIKGIAQSLGEKIAQIPIKLIRFRNNGVKGTFSTIKSPTPQEMEILQTLCLDMGFGQVIVL